MNSTDAEELIQAIVLVLLLTGWGVLIYAVGQWLGGQL